MRKMGLFVLVPSTEENTRNDARIVCLSRQNSVTWKRDKSDGSGRRASGKQELQARGNFADYNASSHHFACSLADQKTRNTVLNVDNQTIFQIRET